MSEGTAPLLCARDPRPEQATEVTSSWNWTCIRCASAAIMAPLGLACLFAVLVMNHAVTEGSCRPTHTDSKVGAPAHHQQLMPKGASLVAVGSMLRQMTGEEKCDFVRGEKSKFVGSTPAIPRLGIPGLRMMDAAQGFRTVLPEHVGQVTAWPCLLAVAATWDVLLVEQFAKALGSEFHAKGANVILGPSVNLHRQPRGGRNAEFLSGEDPYLGAALTAPYVRGVQSEGVLAVVKHFVANNQETNRKSVSSNIDARTLWEVYYPPFQAAVREGVASVMCAYNSVNGTAACGSDALLLRDLKHSIGFSGWVMSDCWATYSFSAPDGLDQSMPVGECSIFSTEHCWFDNAHLRTLSDEKLDDMVSRMLAAMVRSDLGDTCSPEECDFKFRHAVATSAEHKRLARQIAAESVLLHKNEGGVLPLSNNTQMRIALLGSACDAANDVGGLLSQGDRGNAYVIGGSGRVVPESAVSIYQGLVSMGLGGHELLLETSDDEGAALDVGKKADLAIVCGSTTTSEGRDRESLRVDQEQFLVSVAAGLAARNVTVISVTLIPGSIVMPWIKDVQGAVSIFLGGEETGNAVADVLLGRVNPSGRSPVTFYNREEDASIRPCEGTSCDYSEGLFMGWRGVHRSSVLFPFGHGLSYTVFEYEWRERPRPRGRGECVGIVCMSTKIRNAGSRSGAEIAQLYLTFPEQLKEPPLVLRGFSKVHIVAGGEEVVNFVLEPSHLQVYLHGGWQLSDGSYEAHIGASSRDIRVSAAFNIQGGKLQPP